MEATGMETIFGLPPWGFYTLLSLVMTYWISIGGWALARAGRSPLWVLLLCVPWVNVIVIWLFAYARWPAMAAEPDGTREAAYREGDSDSEPPGGESR